MVKLRARKKGLLEVHYWNKIPIMEKQGLLYTQTMLNI